MSRTPQKRPRNAAATRAAILASAREAFARAGYDGAGVREIARGAGVTAMLVNRYFGSKEELFAEVIIAAMSSPTILRPEILASPAIARDIAATLLEITRSDAIPLEGFRIMLYSAASAPAAAIGRREIEAHYGKALTGALRGPHAAERAALIFALVAGVQVMRQMIGLSALTDAPPRVLVDLLAPLLQMLVDGPQR